MQRLLPIAKERGGTSFGTFGFCWGGLMAVKLGASTDFKASGFAHAAMLTAADAEAAKGPVLSLPAKDDQLDDFEQAIGKNAFASHNVWHKFDDVNHGFAASRGDWTNELQAQRATEAIEFTQKFFNENL